MSRDLPIPFSPAMVRALLAGRKTVTRRILVPQFPEWVREAGFTCFTPPRSVSGRGTYIDEAGTDRGPAEKFAKLRYCTGDRLWVREPWRADIVRDDVPPRDLTPGAAIRFEADHEWRIRPIVPGRLRAGMHMPRWASRITLLVDAVRVERLQSISEDEAWAEGVCQFAEELDHAGTWKGLSDSDRRGLVRSTYGSAVRAYSHLWETINGAESWSVNPWVTATTFRFVPTNIDKIEAGSGNG